MKFCIECGNQLSATNKFCTNCGTAVTRSGQENGATPIPNEENEIRNHTKQTEDVTPAKRSVKVVKKSTKITKWIIGAAVAIILIITGTAIAMGLYNGGDEKVAGTAAQTQKETTEKSEPELEKESIQPPNVSQEEISTLFPDWQMIEQDIVQINDTYYTVIAIAQNAVEFEEKVKIAIIDYDSKGEENKWSTVWESEEYYADPIIDMESYIGEYYVLNPDDTSVALVVFNVMHSGTLRMYETYAIQIDESGQGEVAWAGSASYIEKKEDYIEIMVHGSVQLSIEDNEVKTTEIPRSELGSQDALQVEFTLNQDGVVIPTGDEEIYVKKDQPITLIPADETTKSLFDEGDISVYLGNMENGSIPTANAYLVYVGNEFTFTEEGTYGFLLDYYTENSSTPPYTILVHVGDGVKPEESEEEDVASSTEIIAPFAMGTPLDELFEHYGEPTYNDYYNGGWLVVFNKEGYFIDELEETVRGYFFSVPTISVFGATIGMTGEEINSIYGDSVEPYFDDISTGQYVLTFYKNGYKIFFYSEEENGPTSSMWLVEE